MVKKMSVLCFLLAANTTSAQESDKSSATSDETEQTSAPAVQEPVADARPSRPFLKFKPPKPKVERAPRVHIADLEATYVFGGYGRNTTRRNSAPAVAAELKRGEGLINGVDFRIIDLSNHGAMLRWEYALENGDWDDDRLNHWLTTMGYVHRLEFARKGERRGLWFGLSPSIGLSGGQTVVNLDSDYAAEDDLESFVFGARAGLDASFHAGGFMMGVGMFYAPLVHTTEHLKWSHTYGVNFRVGTAIRLRGRR